MVYSMTQKLQGKREEKGFRVIGRVGRLVEARGGRLRHTGFPHLLQEIFGIHEGP